MALIARSTKSNRGKERLLYVRSTTQGVNTTVRGHAGEVYSVVTMIDYKLSMILAKHHNDQIVLWH